MVYQMISQKEHNIYTVLENQFGLGRGNVILLNP